MTCPGDRGSLVEWLAYLEQLHPTTIAMGLERVARVLDSLALRPVWPIVTVGGTNGKGSTCAMLESILSAGGYRVGLYTSPHLLRYNERVRVGRVPASDAQLCRAFVEVERARGATPLTYFEFGTLAAMIVFARSELDAVILEVGLGGRLDAVNAFDGDVAVITSVDLDHMEYLGDTREKIAFEKAGIFRRDRPAVVGEPDCPQSMIDHAQEIGARLLLIDRDFECAGDGRQWRYRGPCGTRGGLPYPALRGEYQLRNAAAALTALDALRDRLPVSMHDIRRGLLETDVAGRFQVLPGRPVVILDVAHNPHAARSLADNLKRMGRFRETVAVFGMLKDKDITGVVAALRDEVTRWLVADIRERRGASSAQLREALLAAGVTADILAFEDVAAAFREACSRATVNDRILVFGSFLTVAQAMAERTQTDAKERVSR
ncbi:MAG TPA: bifunctional tetrahydrofolate synthase/dihydrofolate synthase [Burkholderiales bacterium]|nr:bifunctional tetrahydrofolate synthase/dihydrofolate synthase [Betaproteobacteria bacterium]HQR52498.1 bifunctional tetrahydrofolate synthase/dihydrofolate synthase [Burkholderiales bacterium]